MLDIKFIRENKDVVAEGAKKKHIEVDIDALIAIDDKRLEMLAVVENLRFEQKKMNFTISTEKDEAVRNQIIEEMRLIKDDLKEKEEALRNVMIEWQSLMLKIPNVPDPSAPEGLSEDDNVVISTWGDKPIFDFEPKDHMEIMTKLGMLDVERGTKVHGFRGYFLMGEGVKLCFAIWNYALEFWGEKGFNPIIPPINTRREALLGCGFIPQGEADIYKAQDDTYFVGTSEVPLMGMYMDEVIDKKNLPIKMLGFSPCFRLEAGSHAKDVKGLIRVHEFYKFEQVILCEGNHAESVKYHNEVQKNTEEFIQSLGIPYEVVDACTGDMGFGKVKMFDTNLWVPKEEKYREISSASYFHDFQTRRLGIRYKDDEGKMHYTHSLNCTAIPTPRILVSMIENFQQADGSIKIPQVLQKYFGKDIIK
ncbi:MAG: seryl-tRNA synthetase [Patescibacteria group bacterium]|nr:seryl-tRNA synthetase [Patescibacteria group bacterium]